MGQIGFYYPSEQDRREIKSLCKEIFNGRRSPEIFEAYSAWIPYVVDVFLPLSNSETGDLLAMPFPGSLMDQPYMTFQVILAIQNEFKAHLNERVKRMQAKQKATPRARRRN